MLRGIESDLLEYIIENGLRTGDRLPPLEELSAELQISIGKLREQLEVARALGFVEVKPRTGIRVSPFSFLPAVRFSLLYALAQDRKLFDAFSDLRNHVEFAFFREAVALLTDEDLDHLQSLVERAFAKLEDHPPRIPHDEHRELHLTIYRRLDNPFVKGLLEAYWDAYEAEGLSVFSDYDYLHEVWTYHERIVNAIVGGDVNEAYALLVQHTKLLQKRPQARTTRGRVNGDAATMDERTLALQQVVPS
ncbi:MAG: FCD domain-containing protein [Thermoflexales bacterium]|nr:FCD domain-containing protein [Thermoflexales bacterium]MDW8352382.1 FCD domain-containing protein [Anaerolineae bacterium]